MSAFSSCLLIPLNLIHFLEGERRAFFWESLVSFVSSLVGTFEKLSEGILVTKFCSRKSCL